MLFEDTVFLLLIHQIIISQGYVFFPSIYSNILFSYGQNCARSAPPPIGEIFFDSGKIWRPNSGQIKGSFLISLIPKYQKCGNASRS